MYFSMEYLYAPWREKYILGKKKGCSLCEYARDPSRDEENLVVYRGEHNFIVMNAFPYNVGHVVVAPYRHVSSLEDLRDEERNEMFSLVSEFIKRMKRLDTPPQGFNVGINLGKAAGAGLDTHLHVHIVPRWQGDTNFMTTTAETRVISLDLKKYYKLLRGMFNR